MSKIQPELKDIVEAMRRYIAINKQDVSFIGSFAAFDENGEIKENTDVIVAYGRKDTLLIQLRELREEVTEQEGEFVNL